MITDDTFLFLDYFLPYGYLLHKSMRSQGSTLDKKSFM